MTLETKINQQVFITKLLEKAFYEPTGWSIGINDQIVPVQREVAESGIVFYADFLNVGTGIPVLYHNNIPMLYHREQQFDGAFTYVWQFGMELEAV